MAASRRLVPASVVLLLLALAPMPRAEPEIHRRLAPLQPWMTIVDDPAHADSAWSGLAALLPSLADSSQRGFGWYLMYSAAAALGHVDSMRIAAESSFVYSPHDPSGFRSLAQYLARAGHHLDLAERSAVRTLETPGQYAPAAQRLDDLRWLGYIQLRRGEDSAAIATFERHVSESTAPTAWVLFRLGRLYARTDRATLAVDRLTRGLSSYPRDSTDAAACATLLDSLVGLGGGDVRASRAGIARGQEKARREYWLEAHREGRRAPKDAFIHLATQRTESLGDARGITVAYAWATWCGPCRHSLPILQEWAEHPRSTPVRVVTIDAEGEPIDRARDKVTKFVNERKLRLPVLLADSTAAARWKLDSFPMTLILRDGRIVYRGHGGGLVEGLEAQLESLGSRRMASATPSTPR